MKRLTQRDEYGNADIIGVDSADLQLNLGFDEFNLVTAALNRLAFYEDAHQNGRLLVLPCKVGDKIFELVPKCKPPFGVCLFEGGLGMARCDNRRCKAYIQDRAFCLDDLYEIGKTVFLTREEAEEAMRKGEKDEQ